MRLPRFWATMRRLMLVIALSAAALAVFDWYFRPSPTRVYFVGDLLQLGAKSGGGASLDMTPVINEIASVAPGSWAGGERQHRPGIYPVFLTASVAVRHSETVHRLVQKRLRQIRRRESLPDPAAGPVPRPFYFQMGEPTAEAVREGLRQSTDGRR